MIEIWSTKDPATWATNDILGKTFRAGLAFNYLDHSLFLVFCFFGGLIRFSDISKYTVRMLVTRSTIAHRSPWSLHYIPSGAIRWNRGRPCPKKPCLGWFWTGDDWSTSKHLSVCLFYYYPLSISISILFWPFYSTYIMYVCMYIYILRIRTKVATENSHFGSPSQGVILQLFWCSSLFQYFFFLIRNQREMLNIRWMVNNS
jgi:hypothetical protein